MKLAPVWLVLGLGLAGCTATGPAVGAKAPDAELELLTKPGKFVTIGGEKKVRVLDFWATWCSPCHASMPFIEKLHATYKDKGVEVMGISNESRMEVEKFHSTSGYTYPMFLDSFGDANRRFKVQALPTMVVIDREGVIRFLGSPFDSKEVIAAVEQALKS